MAKCNIRNKNSNKNSGGGKSLRGASLGEQSLVNFLCTVCAYEALDGADLMDHLSTSTYCQEVTSARSGLVVPSQKAIAVGTLFGDDSCDHSSPEEGDSFMQGGVNDLVPTMILLVAGTFFVLLMILLVVERMMYLAMLITCLCLVILAC
jgi:hypothetical protein